MIDLTPNDDLKALLLTIIEIARRGESSCCRNRMNFELIKSSALTAIDLIIDNEGNR